MARAAHRVAAIETFEQRELIGIALHRLGKLQHQLAALAMAHARPGPGVERLARCLDRQVHIGRTTRRALCDLPARRWIENGECLPRQRRDPFTAYEKLVRT